MPDTAHAAEEASADPYAALRSPVVRIVVIHASALPAKLLQHRRKYRKPLLKKSGTGESAAALLIEAQQRVDAQRAELAGTVYASRKQARRAQRDLRRFMAECKQLAALAGRKRPGA